MLPLSDISKNVGRFLSANSTVIMTAFATAGVIGTAVLAARVTPEAARRLDDLKQDAFRMNKEDEPTPMQIVKATWMLYIPALATGAATIGCIVGAQSINTRRQAAALTAYSLSDKAFKEYKTKVIETIGEKKHRDIREEIAQKQVDKNPPDESRMIVTGTGEVWCYEVLTDRYFKSDLETLRKAQNDINAQIISDMYATQNDFYSLVNLPRIKYGDDLGWNTLNMLELVFSTTMSPQGVPCISIDYTIAPIKSFDDLH